PSRAIGQPRHRARGDTGTAPRRGAPSPPPGAKPGARTSSAIAAGPPSQSVCGDTSIQGASAEAKRLGRLTNVAVISAERLLDERLLHLFERELLDARRSRSATLDGQI